jgi:ribonuclease R
MSKTKKAGKRKEDFSEQIIKILSQSANKAFNYKQIEQS